MADGLNVLVTGVEATGKRILEKVLELDKASERIVRLGGVIIRDKAVREFRPRPSGSVRKSTHGPGPWGLGYTSPGKTWYDTRPPFQPRRPRPTQRSGNLRTSIKLLDVRQNGPGRWSSSTGSGLKYAKQVEERGYEYLTPAYEESKPLLMELYRRIWGEVLK